MNSAKLTTYVFDSERQGYQRRACHPSLFANYFRLLPNPNRPRQQELQSFLFKIVQAKFSEKQLQDLVVKNRTTLDGWLECLQEQAVHLTETQAINLFESLSSVADMPIWIDHWPAIGRLMVDLTKQIISDDKQDQFFKKTLTEEAGIFIKLDCLKLLKASCFDPQNPTRWNELDALWCKTFEAILVSRPEAILGSSNNFRALCSINHWKKSNPLQYQAWAKIFFQVMKTF